MIVIFLVNYLETYDITKICLSHYLQSLKKKKYSQHPEDLKKKKNEINTLDF